MEHITNNAQETKELGKRLSADLKGGEVIALSGELGAGKTTFIQGLAEGLGVTERVTSPTFIISRNYPTNKNCELYHVDLYRLEENLENELKNLGLTNVLKEAKDIVVIEWADKMKDLLPEETIYMDIQILDKNSRKITIK